MHYVYFVTFGSDILYDIRTDRMDNGDVRVRLHSLSCRLGKQKYILKIQNKLYLSRIGCRLYSRRRGHSHEMNNIQIGCTSTEVSTRFHLFVVLLVNRTICTHTHTHTQFASTKQTRRSIIWYFLRSFCCWISLGETEPETLMVTSFLHINQSSTSFWESRII